jgi:hypothetical protein
MGLRALLWTEEHKKKTVFHGFVVAAGLIVLIAMIVLLVSTDVQTYVKEV